MTTEASARGDVGSAPPAGVAWLSGDLNLDGAVTGDDYTVVDANLGAGSGNPLSMAREDEEKDDILG